MRDVSETTQVTPEPVDLPSFGSDGAQRAAVQFRPGPVSNYPNVVLLKEAVRRQQGRLRRGTAKTKERAEIHGPNRKPWRQKGTGRARAGSKKSPIWRGGGTVFGPRPRSYDYGLPRRMRQLAVRHALLSKLLDGEARVIADIPATRPSASAVSQLLGKVGTERSVLIGVANGMDREAHRNLVLSARNLPRVEVLPVSDFNVLSLLRNKNLLLTEAALQQIQTAESQLAAGEERAS